MTEDNALDGAVVNAADDTPDGAPDAAPVAPSVQNVHGRPVLGAITGLLFGVFVALDLVLFGVLPLQSGLVYLFPLAGLALGIVLGVWAPLGRKSST